MTIALLMMVGMMTGSSTSHLLFSRSDTLQAQIFPGQTCVEGVAISNLQEDVTWAGIGPLLSHVACQSCQDFPIGPGSGKWTQRLTNSLDVVVNVGHAAIFFSEGHGGGEKSAQIVCSRWLKGVAHA